MSILNSIKTSAFNKGKPAYEKLREIDDDKINILVLGTTGCGKSTLINAILGSEVAETGTGESVTKEISIYTSDEYPFRMIDTIGYEYGLFKQNKVKRELQKFSKEGVKKQNAEQLVHMIWFCIDGTVKRMDQNVLGYLKSVTASWQGIPVIIVFTKSYSEKEIQENIQMAHDAILVYNTKNKKQPLNVKAILPVVAKEYQINDQFTVAPYGLDHLITATNELIPDARKLAKGAIKGIDLKLKRDMSHSYISIAAGAAAVVGAVPIPFPDATVLVPIQTAMMVGISKAYGVSEKSGTNEMINQIIRVGGTTIAGRSLLNGIKAIPGLQIAGAALNAVVAGAITFAAGEVSLNLIEKVYTGETEIAGIDWETEITKLYQTYIPGILSAIESISKKTDGKFTPKQVFDYLKRKLRERL